MKIPCLSHRHNFLFHELKVYMKDKYIYMKGLKLKVFLGAFRAATLLDRNEGAVIAALW